MKTGISKWLGVAAVAATVATAGGFGLVNATSGGGNTLTAIAPCRLVDTRPATQVGARTSPLGAGQIVEFSVRGTNGNCTNIAADAQAASIQLTGISTADTFLTAFPGNETTPPNASQLNPRANIVTSNTTTVTLSPTGTFKLYNHAGSTQIVIDVLGIFSPGGVGAPGPEGPAGPVGPAGPATQATYENPQWGTMLRNVIGDGVASLRGGPFNGFNAGATGIPYGVGSLEFLVGDSASKVAFGNEVDFFGDPLSTLSSVGFQVFTTGENSGRVAGVNMPSIIFEIDPSGLLDNSGSNYSSLVFVPGQNSPSNTWSAYIDATNSGSGTWFLTGAAGTTSGCASSCTLAQVKSAFPSADILTASVSKGRDAAWQGAIDGLRINDTIFDFEPFGVTAMPLPVG